MQHFPTGNFFENGVNEGSQDDELTSMLRTKDDAKFGYFSECVLENPPETQK